MRHTTAIPQAGRIRTIAVIGAGTPAGSTLSVLFALARNRVLLSDPAPEAAARVRKEILAADSAADVEILPCERTSCWEADLIVFAMTLASRSHALDRIRDVATGKIVLAAGAAAESGPALRARLPHARLVTLTGNHIVLASGDDEARQTVERLIDAGERALRRRKASAA